jgi:hypothetical protein
MSFLIKLKLIILLYFQLMIRMFSKNLLILITDPIMLINKKLILILLINLQPDINHIPLTIPIILSMHIMIILPVIPTPSHRNLSHFLTIISIVKHNRYKHILLYTHCTTVFPLHRNMV